MKLYRKLAAALADDVTLPREVRRSLVAGLYQPFASLVVGAVSGTIVAVAAAFWSHDPAIFACAAAVAIVGAARVLLAWTYFRSTSRSLHHEAWETGFSIGAYAFAASLGVLSFLVTTRSSNLALQVITPTFSIGYAAGISGRNAGRPLLAIGQVLLSATPLSVGLLMSGDAERASLGVLALLFAYGMIDITLSTRDIIVTALVTTREKEALAEKFRAQVNLFDIALSNMSHGLCMFDAEGRLQVWNEQFVKIAGIPGDLVREGTSAKRLYERSKAEIDGSVLRRRLSHNRFKGLLRALGLGSLVVRLPDDRLVSLMQRRTAEGGYVVIFEDITERRANEVRIQQMASYDDLTGLMNRSSFRAKVSETLRSSSRQSSGFAVHLIDLDHFKVINDTMGHPAGDHLLRLVASRLRSAAQGSWSVARLGGDEFVVIQNAVAAEDQAVELALCILGELQRPFEIDGVPVKIGASIGIALAPTHADDEDKLLKRADIALYAAKADGRSGFRVFQPELELATQARHAVESDLRRALENGEFELHYQPIVEVATGRVVSCEALVRWKHPFDGYVPPSKFIPVAEDTGLILQLGEWVLHEACREASRWPKDISVAVNLSPRQFSDAKLAFHVVRALERSGLPAGRLELEVTESVTLGGDHNVIAIMDQLRQLGVRLCLDDFGTGYSSLSYLRKYAFDKLKIDRSFVVDLARNDESIAIVRAIVAMGRSLGMAIVVEGVETEAQLSTLEAEGCTLIQGFLFSRPVPSHVIRDKLGAADARLRVAS